LLTEPAVKAGTAKMEAVLIPVTWWQHPSKIPPVIILFVMPVDPEVNWYRNVESLAGFRKIQ
jgi:hypothetical protein